jgi:hypothetical protein
MRAGTGGSVAFSKIAPAWGEFYIVTGSASLLDIPTDWRVVAKPTRDGQHFLFYFRDEMFECIADCCLIEKSTTNALQRERKVLAEVRA